jgi:hypothetical protein
MDQVLLILICVFLNLVPADATSVTIPSEKAEMRLTREDGGIWSMDGSPLHFHVKGTELTMTMKDKGQKLDLSEMAGIDKNTDWTKLKEINLGGRPAQILRKVDGFDLVLKAEQGDKNAPRSHEVRWKQPKAK